MLIGPGKNYLTIAPLFIPRDLGYIPWPKLNVYLWEGWMDAYERGAQKKENRSVSVSEKDKQSVDEFRLKFLATTGNTNSSKPLRKNSWIIKD